MRTSASLTKDANGGAIQVFSPKTQINGAEFSVGASTIFSVATDVAYTLNNGTSIDMLAGDIRGIPNGIYHLVFDTAVDVTFAGNVLAGLEAVITSQPTSLDYEENSGDITFTVVAVGSALTYEWFIQVDGEWITTGETNATLIIAGATTNEKYYCVVTNALGSVNSDIVSQTRTGYISNQLLDNPDFAAQGNWVFLQNNGTVEITGGQLILTTDGTASELTPINARQNDYLPAMPRVITGYRVIVDTQSLDAQPDNTTQVKFYSGVIGSGILEYQYNTNTNIGIITVDVELSQMVPVGGGAPEDLTIVEFVVVGRSPNAVITVNSVELYALSD